MQPETFAPALTTLAAALALPGLAVAAAHAADAPPALPHYAITGTIALGAPDRWDYLAYEPQSHRVFIAHGTETSVVDAETGLVTGHVGGLNRAHGVVLAPKSGRGFADSGEGDTVTLFDLQTLQPLGTVPTAAGPDAMAYDPATGRVFAIAGKAGAVTAIDAATGSVAGTVPLGGTPEFATADGAGKLYVNIESTREIVRIDAATLKLEARWPIAACESPHGLAIDPATRRLFSTCVNQLMLVVDAESGRIVATLPIGRGSDAAGFDPVRKLAFSSNGEGTLSVIAEIDAEHFTALGEVKTLPGARTMAVDPVTGRIFLVTAERDPSAAETGRFQAKPGTAELVILTPGG